MRASRSSGKNNAGVGARWEDEPEPSTGIVRSFSDDWKQREADHLLSQGLSIKVESDRRKEERLSALRREWILLFADADHLAQL